MGDSSNSMGKSSDQDDIIELAGKVTVVAIIFLFFVVIFCCCLHLYFKWFYLNHQSATSVRRRRRRRLDFAAGDQEIVVTTPSSPIGLEPSLLKSIAIVTFKSNEYKEGLECAVCLCEISEGEKARILPKCKHGFHVECIDMWFQSHATCPLCRNPISNQKKISNSESTVVDDQDQDHSSSEGPNLPTNVLFWGGETQVNAFGPCAEEDHLAGTPAQPSTSATTTTSGSPSPNPNGMVVIDINLHSGQEIDL